MKWKLNPCTIHTWLNWYTSQWDLFIESFSSLKEDENINDKIFFKKADDKSYLLFRKITQLVDFLSLDYNRLSFSNREILASALLLCLLENCSLFAIMNYKSHFTISDYEDLSKKTDDLVYNLEEGKYNSLISLYHIPPHTVQAFIETFNNFLHQSFNFELVEINKAFFYVSQHLGFLNETVVEIPITVQMAPEDDLDINNVRDLLIFRDITKTSLPIKLITKPIWDTTCLTC